MTRRRALCLGVALGLFLALLGAGVPAAADDASDAAKVAGLLRSADPLERLKGESMLLERTRAGGDFPGFLRALAEALAPRAAVPPAPPTPPTRLPTPPAAFTVVVYDVRDLLDGGKTIEAMRAVLLGAVPDAEVRLQGTSLEVRATRAGHEAAGKALAAARAALATPVVVTPPTPKGDGTRVFLESQFFELPAAEAAALLGDAKDRVRMLDAEGVRAVETRLAGAKKLWAPTVMALTEQEATMFVGESTEYRRDVVRGADGIWRIVKGRIEEGRRIALTPSVVGGRLHIPLRVSETTAARPIPTTTVKPAPEAPSFEIDAPQWTSLSTTADLDLPAPSGVALVHLPGLNVVLLLRYRVEPPAPSR